jgi:hypothetical protein
MNTINEVAVTTENGEDLTFGMSKRGRVILYPDGILNIEDGGGRVTTLRWHVKSVALRETEPLREMA